MLLLVVAQARVSVDRALKIVEVRVQFVVGNDPGGVAALCLDVAIDLQGSHVDDVAHVIAPLSEPFSCPKIRETCTLSFVSWLRQDLRSGFHGLSYAYTGT